MNLKRIEMHVSENSTRVNKYAHSFWEIVVTMGGVGYTPYAPGTAGAIIGLLSGWIIMEYAVYPSLWLIALIVIFTVLGTVGSFRLEKDWGKDSQKIVIDEVAGMWISLLYVPFEWFFYILAFILFRFFDIFKPLGIHKIQNLTGGYGVMADDIVAGLVTNLVLQVVFLAT